MIGFRITATSLLCGLSSVVFCLGALGQEARTPEELAAQIAYAISSGEPGRLALLVDPSTEPEALRVLSDRLMLFRGAEGFNVSAVGARDETMWWGSWRRSYRVEEFAQWLSENVTFPVEPLGRISVNQAPTEIPFRCTLGVMYGRFGQRYLLMLAKTREGKMEWKSNCCCSLEPAKPTGGG